MSGEPEGLVKEKGKQQCEIVLYNVHAKKRRDLDEGRSVGSVCYNAQLCSGNC